MEKRVIIPADYCVALIDATTYPSFVSQDWGLDQLVDHFVAQMHERAMIAWGTGAPGNWRIIVTDIPHNAVGYREFRGQIRVNGSNLHLTSYDELTFGAQFEHARLPRAGTEDWSFDIVAGDYVCRVVQLYDPDQADSKEVFDQKTPHFILEIVKSERVDPNDFRQVPWFQEAY